MGGHPASPPVVRLRPVGEATLPCLVPFDFDHTFCKPSQFPTGLEAHTTAATWRSYLIGDELAGVRVRPDEGGVRVRVYSAQSARRGFVSAVLERVDHDYGLVEDLAGFYDQAAGDPALEGPARRLRGMRVGCPGDAFEIGVIAVLLQNCGIGRTVGMLTSLLSAYGRVVELDGVRLRAFYTPEDIADVPVEDLRRAGNLGYRDERIARLASLFTGRDLDPMTTDRTKLVDELFELRGVGLFAARFVAQWALKDHDATPIDVWNGRIIAGALGMEGATVERVRRELFRRFPGEAGVAMQYLIEDHHLGQSISARAPSKDGLICSC